MKRNICAVMALCLLLGCLLTGCGGVKVELYKTWQENYDQGGRYVAAGYHNEAVRSFQEAVRLDPQKVEGYIALAKAQLDSGDQETAIKTLQDGMNATGDAVLQDYLHWAEVSQDTSVEGKPVKVMACGNLTVEIYDEITMRLTLRDENLLPSYTVKQKTKYDWDTRYIWRVDFTDGPKGGVWSVRTDADRIRLSEGEYSVAEMIHEMSIYSEYKYENGVAREWASSLIDFTTASVWENCITWRVAFPYGPDSRDLDLRYVEFFVVDVQNDDQNYWFTETYVVEEDTLKRVDAMEDFYGEYKVGPERLEG